jgi:hypothetical protein
MANPGKLTVGLLRISIACAQGMGVIPRQLLIGE